ncbi:eukaryotic translation initiation factor 4 gamma [Novymonas esmeraldas]|uniref:Eukaryotic translation initiation factor 4 gamma n=1 Tax=Novymonas esmeraldas TaxID=1808958 RepID=A0AAW0ENN9_9TRYP
MQFTVEQIRSVRGSYTEPPYPGFSLDEVIRRSGLAQTKLVRGENAWVMKGAVQSTEEWVCRLLRGTLNKLTEKNKNIMVDQLLRKELFVSPEMIDVVVSMIFKKAIEEPENGRLYAGVCLSLARYESNVVRELNKGEKAHSELRNSIVKEAQLEFRLVPEDPERLADMSPEEIEMDRSNMMRRKRSNMRFIGELFLCTALSYNSVAALLTLTMRHVGGTDFPSSDSIELFAALLETVGEQFDKNPKKTLDKWFTELESIRKRADNPYPPRIRFMIMDLLDLRQRGWKARNASAKAAAPLSSHKDRKAAANTTTAAAAAAAAAPPPPRRGGGRDFDPAGAPASTQRSWRDGAPSSSGPMSMAGKGLHGRGTFHSGASASPPPPPPPPLSSASFSTGPAVAAFRDRAVEDVAPEVPLVKFELRVSTMLHEWVADRTNDIILGWVDQFNTCDRIFESETELCVAVAQTVIHSACTTTRKDAQREAFSFLVVGLFMIDSEVLDGFASALAAAIEDGVLEDVPKFGERFMNMLRLTSTEQETRADVYFDAANVLRQTYERLESPDAAVVDTLMAIWDYVEQPPTGEEVQISLSLDVVFSLCSSAEAQDGVERLLSRLLHSMVCMQLITAEVLEAFLELTEGGVCEKVIQDYKTRFPTAV